MNAMAELARVENARLRKIMDGERRWGKGGGMGFRNAEKAAARRALVKRMWSEGRNVCEIKDAVGCSINTVRNDMIALGLKYERRR